MAAAYQSGAVLAAVDNSVTALAVTAPTGIAVGDQLVGFAGCANSRTFSAPAGWTTQLNNTDGSARVYVWTKTADSGDAAASTFTFTASAGFGNLIAAAHRADGIDTATAPTISSSTGANDQTQTCPTITAPADGSLFFWWLYYGAFVAGPASADKGTERTDTGNSTSDEWMAAYTSTVSGTGSITGATITTAGFGAKRVISVAFGPSGGGGADTLMAQACM